MVTKRNGRDFVVKLGQADGPPETFTVIGPQRATSLAINNAMVDTTDKQDAPWRKLLGGAGIKSMSISLSGDYSDDAQIRAIQLAIMSITGGDIRNFKLVAGNLDSFVGAFQIVSFSRDGGVGDQEKYTLKLESSGAIVYTPGP